MLEQLIENPKCQVGPLIPIKTPALRRPGQEEGYMFKASVDSIMSFRQAWATECDV